jgi:hypothetical protein
MYNRIKTLKIHRNKFNKRNGRLVHQKSPNIERNLKNLYKWKIFSTYGLEKLIT